MPITSKIEEHEQQRRAEIVSQSFGGIQPPCEAFYIHSILYSTKCCLEAFSRYVVSVEKKEPAAVLIGALQEAIGHAGALSRYFWPTPFRDKKRKEVAKMIQSRGAKLRLAFGLTKSSPLYRRELRNTWEHFDENLDLFLLEFVAGTFFPSPMIGNCSDTYKGGGHFFKLLDPSEECLILLGERFEFGAIRDEVRRIDLIAKSADANGARLPIGSNYEELK